MPTASPKTCPTCDTEIPAWAIAGNCPTCMMGGGGVAPEETNPKNEVIAGWEIGERLGEGAFGVVFKARQTRPVTRSGAIKILRPAMSSKEILARFEAERQALAMLDHEGIVTIFDAGTTDDGRPFYVMEFIDGEPVTKFAADFSLEEKLALFDNICEVVAHAHISGVIHRDLKPANILAYQNGASGPKVKLLDFGIAKATENVLTEKTLMTTEGQLLGTPEYISPEQASGGDIDTRSDVYSLGVIFFELLAGRPPFILSGNSIDAVMNFLKSVREGTAARPSEYASGPVPTDLEWIAGKAIEQDPRRRYQTVRELRDDLKRFIEDQPVTARPPDQIYIARKFLRRHWKAATVAAALVGTITAAAIISTVMALRANEASLETAAAYSRSDVDSAVRSLDQNRITEAMTSLHRALENQPSNVEANRLLNSVTKHFPVARLIREDTLDDRGVSQSLQLGDDGTAVFMTEDGTLKWTDDGTAVRVGGSHHRKFESTPEGLLATGNSQGMLALVDLDSRSLHSKNLFGDDKTRLTDYEFSANGDIIFAAKWDMGISAHQVKTGALLWETKARYRPFVLHCSTDDAALVIGLGNGMIEKRDPKTGELTGEPINLSGEIHQFLNLGNGEILALHGTGFVTQFDIKHLRQRRLAHTWHGDFEIAATRTNRVDSSNQLCSFVEYAIGSDAGVFIWSLLERTPIRLSTDSPVVKLAFHPAREVIAVGTEGTGIQLFDFKKNRLIATDITQADNPIALNFSESGERLFVVTRRGRHQVYVIPDALGPNEIQNERLTKIPAPFRAIKRETRDFEMEEIADISWPEFPLNFPPQAATFVEPYFAASCRSPEVGLFLWHSATGELIRKIAPYDQSFIRCATISEDGKWMAYSPAYGKVLIENVETGYQKPFELKHGRSVSCVAIDSVCKKIATATFGCEIRVFNFETGELIAGPMRHHAFGDLTRHYCRFSRDGDRLVSWGQTDNRFRVWDSATGQPVCGELKLPGKPRFAQFHPKSDEFLLMVSETENGRFFARIQSSETGIPVTPVLNFEHFPTAGDVPLPSLER